MSLNGLLHLRKWGQAGLFIFFSLKFPCFLSAQEVEIAVKGGFLSDSLKIGNQTAYYLAASYPSHLTLLFPDSTHSFEPFEYQSKRYFFTDTKAGLSTDSTIYYLTTFEIDRVQYLHLPVYVVHNRDSTVMHTATDSVLITQFVAQVPDSLTVDKLPLRMNAAYQKVFYNFNFWLWVIIITSLLVVAGVVWVVFRKKISRYFQTRRLQKNHAYFIHHYNAFLSQLQITFSSLTTESALTAWKKYMEQLESRPYTKLTTRETLRLLKEPVLREHLTTIDKAIYGHHTSAVESLEKLKIFADQQYKRKLKEVQHG